MRNFALALVLVVFVSLVFSQTQPKPEETTTTKPTPPLKPVIFVPAGATLLTELQLTKEDLLPVVAQVFSYFSLQHSGGQFIQGDQLRDLIASMEALWLVEYDFRQKGATPADLLQMNQSLLEAQGWRRVFWNRSNDGNRETMVMVEPPRKGLFVLLARRDRNAENIRVIAIRTQGEIDVGTTLWLLTTFLMRPELPTPTPPTPSSPSEKTPSVKPTPEKSPEKSPQEKNEQGKTPDGGDDKVSGKDDNKGKKSSDEI
ncbi:MAG: hypothetical protein ACK40X_11220 [Armatimonadota bacterium]